MTKYVWSGAGGSNTGESWANAWTSIASASAAAAGEIVKVHKGHVQADSGSSALTITLNNGTASNPVRIVSVDKDAGDVPSFGAKLCNNTQAGGHCYLQGHGVIEDCVFDISFWSSELGCQLNDARFRLKRCTLTIGSRVWTVNSRSILDLIDCITTTGYVSSFGNSSRVTIRGGTLTSTSSTNTFDVWSTNTLLVEGVDMSACSGVSQFLKSHESSTAWVDVVIRNCTLPSGWTIAAVTSANPMMNIMLTDNAVGSISVPPLGITELNQRPARVSHTEAAYRIGGSDDGWQATPQSIRLVNNATGGSQLSPACTPWITRTVAAGANQTLTMYFASADTKNNNEVWMEVLSPNEIASPNTKAHYKFRETAFRSGDTPVAVSTDTDSTWTAPGIESQVAVKQKTSVTINPAVGGLVRARLVFTKPSSTLYCDGTLGLS